MRYRKKPVIIEAMQLTRRYADVVLTFIGRDKVAGFNLGEFREDECFIEIETPGGIITAQEGDYIICGIVGDFYPCKPDIFEANYEPIEDTTK